MADEEDLIQHLLDLKKHFEEYDIKTYIENIEELRGQIDKLIYQIEDLDSSQQDIEETLDSLQRRVQEVEKDIARVDFPALSNRLDEIEDEIKELRDDTLGDDFEKNVQDSLSDHDDRLSRKVDWRVASAVLGVVAFMIMAAIGFANLFVGAEDEATRQGEGERKGYIENDIERDHTAPGDTGPKTGEGQP